MTEKFDVSETIRAIEAEKAKISAARDKLREILDDVESITGDCAEAVESLEYAADALSRLL